MLLFNMVSEELKRAKGVRVLLPTRPVKSRSYNHKHSLVNVLLNKKKKWVSPFRVLSLKFS